MDEIKLAVVMAIAAIGFAFLGMQIGEHNALRAVNEYDPPAINISCDHPCIKWPQPLCRPNNEPEEARWISVDTLVMDWRFKYGN